MFNVKVVKATILREHLSFVVAIAHLQMFRKKLYIFCGDKGRGVTAVKDCQVQNANCLRLNELTEKPARTSEPII